MERKTLRSVPSNPKNCRFPLVESKKPLMANNQVLPDEMIDEILLRLPEEPLFRFKSVSHAWNTRINSPAFVKSYGESRYNSKKVMMCPRGPEPTIYSFSLSRREEGTIENVLHDFGNCGCSDDNSYRIAGSCDGLLLTVIANPYKLCIWNPFTRQYKQLLLHSDNEVPSIDTTHYGFGSMNLSAGKHYSDYKVLLIQSITYGERSRVFWYTTRTNLWRRKDDIPYAIWGDSCAVVNTKLHFFAWSLLDRHSVILAFDIGDEELREIPKPDYEDDKVGTNSVSELNGKLCVISSKWRNEMKMYVWVMKEYGEKESWTIMFCINGNNIRYLGIACCHVKPLHLDVDGKILLHVQFEFTSEKKLLVYYDSKNQEARIIKPDGLPNYYMATIYAETLISLNVV